MMTLGESGDGEIQVGELETLGRMMYREVGRHGGDAEGGMQKLHRREVGGKYADINIEERYRGEKRRHEKGRIDAYNRLRQVGGFIYILHILHRHTYMRRGRKYMDEKK